MVLGTTALPLISRNKDEGFSSDAAEKLKCISKGGKWDSKTQTCIMPENKLKPETTPESETKSKSGYSATTSLTTPEVYSDKKGNQKAITLPGEGRYGIPTGNITPEGITETRPATLEEYNAYRATLGLEPDIGGRTFGGLAQKGVQQIAGAYQEKTTLPEGTVQAGTGQANYKETLRKVELARSVGEIDLMTAMEAEEQGINVKEALLSGVSGVIPSALSYGATTGAAALFSGVAAPLAPAAAGVGAVVGALKGFYSGVTNNIKAQKSDLISGKSGELSSRQKAMKGYISAANANPAKAEEMLQAYQIEKSLIRRDYNTLNAEAGESSSLMYGQDGTPQLIAYNVYFESVEPQLDLRMQEAILKPEPSRAYLDVGDFE